MSGVGAFNWEIEKLIPPYDLLFLPHLEGLRKDEFQFGKIKEGQRYSYLQFLVKAFVKNSQRDLFGFKLEDLSSQNKPLLEKLDQVFEPSYGISQIGKVLDDTMKFYRNTVGYHDGGIFVDTPSNLLEKSASSASSTSEPLVNIGVSGKNQSASNDLKSASERINSKKLQITFFCNEPSMNNLLEEDKVNFLTIIENQINTFDFFTKKSIKNYIFEFQEYQSKPKKDKAGEKAELVPELKDNSNTSESSEPNDNIEKKEIFTMYLEFNKRQTIRTSDIFLPISIPGRAFEIKGLFYKVKNEKLIFLP